MTGIDQILGEFIDAWNAGERPDVQGFVARASAGDRDELAERIATWLLVAPTPQFDEPTLTAISAEPRLRAALDEAAALRAPLHERLPLLRERAGLAVRDVARRLVAVFGIDDEERAAAYLEGIERDEVDPGRLSRRLLDALAAILGADRHQLDSGPGSLATGQAFFRSDEDAGTWLAQEVDALSRAALAPAPEPMDELDRLFLGGPDA